MKDENVFKRIIGKIRWFFGNRVLPLGVIVAVMIYVIVVNLHDLQILQSLEPAAAVTRRGENRVREVYIDAPRGNIFDKYGRPLAINEEVNVIRVNPAIISRPGDELIASVVEFVRLANLFGEEVIVPSTIMVTAETPFAFTTTSAAALRSWMLDMSVIFTNMPAAPNHEDARFYLSSTRDEVLDVTEICPEYVIERLEDYFRMPEEMPPGVCRREVLELCAAIYMQRYFFAQITVARDVGPRLAVAIEERGDILPNFYSDVEFLRVYPAGEYVAHMIGFVRPLGGSERDLEMFGGSGRFGLASTDMFGATGIERAFQLSGDLGGVRGIRQVEIDPMGRRVSNRITEPALPGNDVFLSIDLQLQQTAVRSMEHYLAEVLAAKLTNAGAPTSEQPVPPSAVIAGLIRTNNVSIADIMAAESGSMLAIRTFVEAEQNRINIQLQLIQNEAARNEQALREEMQNEATRNEEELDEEALNTLLRELAAQTQAALAEVARLDTFTQIREFLAVSVEEHNVAVPAMLRVLSEQGVITMTADESSRLSAGTLSIPHFLAARIRAGEITPRMALVAPYSASLVVKCVHTGAVLAAANYPNFDNNNFVYPRNVDYIVRSSTDPAHPQVNRVFQTNRPPGSTFKMITAVAGLEQGVIQPNSILTCRGTFTRAGWPYIRCWTIAMMGAGRDHGPLSVVYAISESCNYFFFETAWRLGDTAVERVEVLNEYMRRFGLDTQSGVEIGNRPTFLSSPSFRMQRLGDGRWTNMETVATAIGQSLNNYNTVIMAKYMATLVNGGYRYQSHLLHRIADNAGQSIRYFEPVLEEVVGISPRNHETIMTGMYNVFYVGRGTGRGFFDDFPIIVGGKTGTAENGTLNSDESLAVFAPFHDPQIAIYVMIPFGDTRHFSRPAAHIAREVLACYFRLDWPLSEPNGEEYNEQPSWFTE